MSAGDAGPSPLVDFIAGTAGGIASLVAGHPFDTVKTRLQTQPVAAIALPTGGGTSAIAAGSQPTYRSATDAFRVIFRDEKLIGMYKGITSPMLGVAVMNASVFGVYGLALRMQLGDKANGSDPSRQASLGQIFLAGAASGVVSAFITAPIDLIKIREQLDFRSGTVGGTRPSTLAVIKGVWAKHGLRGLYRGLGATCIRDVGYGPYFWSYEYMNRRLLSMRTRVPGDAPPSLSNAEMALSGAVAGVLAWMSTFWADCVKTRVQASDAPMRGGSAFWRAARQTYAEGGAAAFWRGVRPTILRAIPVNASLFLVYETTKDVLTKWGM